MFHSRAFSFPIILPVFCFIFVISPGDQFEFLNKLKHCIFLSSEGHSVFVNMKSWIRCLMCRFSNQDAASLAVAILKKQFRGRIFLGCDNHPLSRLNYMSSPEYATNIMETIIASSYLRFVPHPPLQFPCVW